uniref:Uncharacterized protein n=1 Tax=Siphoviridae sp. ctLqe90 TaxID=2825456 RepID=A0A8S5Q227_9CAUD|nr:MAG TPA: hypothetical protein [Siphoviridae sp. ctLqe90]DAZ23659.1 MAG TPA: hypothetical protein [Caudoviricetes sp.]
MHPPPHFSSSTLPKRHFSLIVHCSVNGIH